MPDMFDRYTGRARRVLILAGEEARTLNHPEIDAGHLLHGLAAEDGGVAAVALKSLGVTAGQIHDAIAARQRPGPAPVNAAAAIPFSPAAKKVLELALREGLLLGCSYVGTEHLLLGLLRYHAGDDPLSVFSRVAGAVIPSPGSVRSKVLELLCGYGGQARLGEAVSVRFPVALEAGRGSRGQEHRRVVIAAEIARRHGFCQACGQPLPAAQGP